MISAIVFGIFVYLAYLVPHLIYDKIRIWKNERKARRI